VNSLNKLKDTKSKIPRLSLLHYISQVATLACLPGSDASTSLLSGKALAQEIPLPMWLVVGVFVYTGLPSSHD
jgi:hypothetical protein